MTKKQSMLMVFGFCLFLFAGIVLHLAVPDIAFSETEKRPLESFLAPSPDALTSGRFMNSLERYANDHFPFRPFFVGLKSESEKAIGKFDNGRVWFGRDGYLFEKKTATPDLAYHAKSLHDFADYLAKEVPDSNRYLLIAPTATTENAEELPPFAPVVDQQQALATLYEQAGSYTVIDTLPALAAADGQMYYRNDHHWTSAGARTAYDVYANAAGLRTSAALAEVPLTNDFLGTTYAKAAVFSPVPDTLSVFRPTAGPDPNDLVRIADEHGVLLQTGIYDLAKLDESDPYLVFIGRNVAYLKIESNANSGRTLLLIKDSYANSMLPFLTQVYDTIHVIDLRYYAGSLQNFIAMTGPFDDTLICYNFVTFADDTNLYRLTR